MPVLYTESMNEVKGQPVVEPILAHPVAGSTLSRVFSGDPSQNPNPPILSSPDGDCHADKILKRNRT